MFIFAMTSYGVKRARAYSGVCSWTGAASLGTVVIGVRSTI
ncbi:MAG: hypothetical protein JWN93_3804 [Hyphomicrobiales bacterium]|nr:hypothetical protein [Hyphomicrobiales bacterium]